jgi:hypothetical protein
LRKLLKKQGQAPRVLIGSVAISVGLP